MKSLAASKSWRRRYLTDNEVCRRYRKWLVLLCGSRPTALEISSAIESFATDIDSKVEPRIPRTMRKAWEMAIRETKKGAMRETDMG